MNAGRLFDGESMILLPWQVSRFCNPQAIGAPAEPDAAIGRCVDAYAGRTVKGKEGTPTTSRRESIEPFVAVVALMTMYTG